MSSYNMTESEENFAQLIWQLAPVSSGELVKRCETQFDWKKSTTYTMLKKLCEKRIFRNEDAMVTPLITKEEYQQNKSKQFVEENFGGSLPKFLTAFIGKKKLSAKQIAEIQAMIDTFGEE